MATNLERYRKDLDRLILQGEMLYYSICLEHAPEQTGKLRKMLRDKFPDLEKTMPNFSENYQAWYSEALQCVRQLMPTRVEDFISLYKVDAKRKEITYENYSIADALVGLHVTSGWQKEKVVGPDAAIPKYRQQQKIIESLKAKFGSSLFEIRKLVQADLFDSELDAARELNGKGFSRGAGAMAGVVLERHLSHVCIDHSVKVTKKSPSINDFNQALKDAGVIEVDQWRFIQHLGDLRNLCDHDKQRKLEKGEIDELISGVARITKTLL